MRLLLKYLSPGIKVFICSFSRLCLLKHREILIWSGKFLFVAPIGISTWKMIFSVLCFSPLLSTLPWTPTRLVATGHFPELSDTCRWETDCYVSTQGQAEGLVQTRLPPLHAVLPYCPPYCQHLTQACRSGFDSLCWKVGRLNWRKLKGRSCKFKFVW